MERNGASGAAVRPGAIASLTLEPLLTTALSRDQPLSPELVLVGGSYRASEIAAVPERPWEMYTHEAGSAAQGCDDVSASSAQASKRWLAMRIALYAGWQVLLGVLLAIGAVSAFALIAVVIGLLSG